MKQLGQYLEIILFWITQKNLSVTKKAKDSVLTLESNWLPQQNIYNLH